MFCQAAGLVYGRLLLETRRDEDAWIGMVGCSVSDVCAEAWLQWARSPARSPNLYMLCIEENSYSASMRARLDTSGLALPILLTEALNSTIIQK